MRIAAFPAKIARWADADGFNDAFVLHWRKCFSIRGRSGWAIAPAPSDGGRLQLA